MLARKDKDVQWENNYVDKVSLLNELAKERIAFLASFKLPGIWQEDLKKIIDGGTTDDGNDDGDDDGDGTAGTVSGDTTEAKIWNFFAGKGLSATAVAAVMGNLEQESSFNPEAVGPQTKYGKAYGLGQWLGGRLSNLKKHASKAGKTVDDVGTQLEFLWWELNGGDPTTKSKLDKKYGGMEKFKKMGIDEAVVAYEDSFERSGGSAVDKRKKYARKWYKKWGKTGPGTGTGTKAKGDAKKVIETAETWLKKSTKYTWGGGRNEADIKAGRFDCSSFCRWAFAENGYDIMNNGFKLWGNTRSILENKKLKTIKAADLQPGDLVFFDTNRDYGHVTIYLGDDKCIGCQSSKGVSILDMNNSYYKTRISKTHRRVF